MWVSYYHDDGRLSKIIVYDLLETGFQELTTISLESDDQWYLFKLPHNRIAISTIQYQLFANYSDPKQAITYTKRKPEQIYRGFFSKMFNRLWITKDFDNGSVVIQPEKIYQTFVTTRIFTNNDLLNPINLCSGHRNYLTGLTLINLEKDILVVCSQVDEEYITEYLDEDDDWENTPPPTCVYFHLPSTVKIGIGCGTRAFLLNGKMIYWDNGRNISEIKQISGS